jgi:hypothetical protein
MNAWCSVVASLGETVRLIFNPNNSTLRPPALDFEASTGASPSFCLLSWQIDVFLPQPSSLQAVRCHPPNLNTVNSFTNQDVYNLLFFKHERKPRPRRTSHHVSQPISQPANHFSQPKQRQCFPRYE